MYNIVTVTFKDSNTATANGVRQWDYGQILRIQGLQLPTAVEVHFALIDSKDSVTRIGITKDGVTDVVIPDSMIEAGKNIFAYVYLRDSESGQTEYEIKIVVTTRAKPEAFDTPEDKELFAQAIEAVNEAADRAEKAGQAATEAVETAKTEAVQAVQAEGAKQIKEVQDKGAEVLQSIPEDFATQMETKLNKQQGIENKGKVLVIGEDGNVVPEEVASGGGDGIAIINTMSGESPLVIPDSAERVNKRLELGGKTEQVQTTGKNLLPDKFSIYAEGKSKTNLKLQIGNYVYSSKTSKNLYILHEDKSNITNGWTATNKFNFKIDKEETIEVRIETENPLEILPMIREETELDSYEPYTGGKPSPSQEYPQEIKSVGKWNDEKQKYEVDVKVTGKNLFDREKAKDTSNWIIIDGDGYMKFPIYVKKGNKITFSYTEKPTTGKKFYLGIAHSERGSVIAWLYHDVTSSLINNKYTTVATNDYVYLMCNKNAIQNFLDTIQTLQAEISQTQTNYQPYKEQTLTLTSDRPITKWDRLVEQGGQIGWLYGGKIIDSYNSEQIDAEYMSSTGSLTVGATVLYKLKTTEFVPLPQSEQNAIRALKTYYPTTVITVDGGEVDPDIKVTYTADTKNYIDGKVSAKVASILRQYQADTANLLSLMPMETQATMIENDTNNILNNLESEEAHE
ncbi:tail fiber protein [Ruminococcus phage phiRg519T2]|uniref:Tail fiber protein n=1 Tax=Ruminococcus phage phiRg519T2 TaxID=2772519 RepID=A0AAE7T304_9CAUD|nr:tail fiber protein [Ruminococcus phage phiRg519T2]